MKLVFSLARLGLLEPEGLRLVTERLFGTASCQPSSELSSGDKSSLALSVTGGSGRVESGFSFLGSTILTSALFSLSLECSAE